MLILKNGAYNIILQNGWEHIEDQIKIFINKKVKQTDIDSKQYTK